MNTKAYIEMAKGPPISGDYDYENNSDRNERRKANWLRTGARIARELAKALGLPPRSFDVRTNPAGPAVSGDVHLHGEWIYFSLEQSCLGPDFGFMWRLCRGRKDYTGRGNQWASWDELLDLPRLAAKMLAARQAMNGRDNHGGLR